VYGLSIGDKSENMGVNFGLVFFRGCKNLTADIRQTIFVSARRNLATFMGLANRKLFPEFRELSSGLVSVFVCFVLVCFVLSVVSMSRLMSYDCVLTVSLSSIAKCLFCAETLSFIVESRPLGPFTRCLLTKTLCSCGGGCWDVKPYSLHFTGGCCFIAVMCLDNRTLAIPQSQTVKQRLSLASI